ncbi:hypothetical protein [Ralstonia solanacearum]|uniref:Surface antigen n=1 Tax=Ralstonia solanacearum TaxID=305 RepID=A0AAD0S5A7_RALSL|nr:hypothetical protein [Ralstonia solanacearum]AMP36674.1 hypothetical protein LBM2029_03590 [Ralstonia solanacearum]AXV80671.1 hypothetical protein CJO77_03460 [Ralstonia solanacearum]AXV85476.1 hypothetical protein CJO78_03735 [Ralstonia solanacearum]AXW04988.1 hypothetical protein CJO82_03510 [Ralstonia solanacearum]AXW22733.1 hypothetical protein CJO86_03535 [Ralstonia solanacearum]
MNRHLASLATTLMGLGVCACATAQDVPVGTCRPMMGQTEIDGVVQQVSGTACLQPDGTWQMADGTPVAYAGPPYYVDDTWYWAPAGVVFGGVIFIDRFHHAHRMHDVFFHHDGRGFGRGGFHHGGGHGGGHGGHEGGHEGGRGGGGAHH